ncbi:MAG: hypothetical protein ACYCZN_02195 [Candidatus Dormibacteria bacterium]
MEGWAADRPGTTLLMPGRPPTRWRCPGQDVVVSWLGVDPELPCSGLGQELTAGVGAGPAGPPKGATPRMWAATAAVPPASSAADASATTPVPVRGNRHRIGIEERLRRRPDLAAR